jgi:hypothetical protein
LGFNVQAGWLQAEKDAELPSRSAWEQLLRLASSLRFGHIAPMESQRRSSNVRRVVLVGAVILITVLILFLIGLPTRSAAPPIQVVFMPPRAGHMGNLYSQHFSIATVTNTTRWMIGLDNPVVQWEAHGVVVSAMASLWSGTNNHCFLESGEATALPFQVPTNSTKFRISFEYTRDAGLLQKILSPALRLLFSHGLQGPFGQRLGEKGWLDGYLHFNYQGTWEPNQ